LVALLAGVFLGNYLSHKIKDTHFRKVTLILLILLGILSVLGGLNLL